MAACSFAGCAWLGDKLVYERLCGGDCHAGPDAGFLRRTIGGQYHRALLAAVADDQWQVRQQAAMADLQRQFGQEKRNPQHLPPSILEHKGWRRPVTQALRQGLRPDSTWRGGDELVLQTRRTRVQQNRLFTDQASAFEQRQAKLAILLGEPDAEHRRRWLPGKVRRNETVWPSRYRVRPPDAAFLRLNS